MAHSGEYERFVETGSMTYHRPAQAKDYYEKLFKLRPQLYVRGTFKDSDGVYAIASDWVPVEVLSNGFRDRSTGVVYKFVGKFDFMLDRALPGG